MNTSAYIHNGDTITASGNEETAIYTGITNPATVAEFQADADEQGMDIEIEEYEAPDGTRYFAITTTVAY